MDEFTITLDEMEESLQRIKASIRSEEQITLQNLDKFTDSISYEKIAEVKFGGYYYTEVLMTIDLDAAKKDFEEYYEDEEEKKEWTGNIFDWLGNSKECQFVEDGVCPGGYEDEVEVEYL